MNSLKNKVFRVFTIITFFASSSVFAQEVQQKKITESFQVNKDVVIDLDASHTDIEFDTWNKNRVEVEAVLEIDNVSKEEADLYFNNWEFEALGNSSRINIVSKYKPSHQMFIYDEDINIDIEPFEFGFQDEISPLIIELSEMSPMPPMEFDMVKMLEFDYDAYEKNGEEYLVKWKENWSKANEGKLKENMEVWKKEMEMWKKELEHHKKLLKEENKKVLHLQKEKMEHHKHEIAQRVKEAKERTQKVKGNKALYFSSDKKKYNVKRKIKIRMPKEAKLKMNVRHGEVKLSDNGAINADLSHTKLYANTIKGKNTTINASYSPIVVENWNRGNLNVNYNKDVLLKNVQSIQLESNSSNVTINQLLNSAYINSNFGKLDIHELPSTFKNLNIILDNADAFIALPTTSHSLQYNGVYSKINHPKNADINKHIFVIGNPSANKTIVINARYSNVVFD